MSDTTRAPSMLLVLLFLAGVLAPTPALAQSSGATPWLESLDEGLRAAGRMERPLLVLITAPGWCGHCEDVEERALTDTGVQDVIRNDFVAVRLTDRDPAHAGLDFPGYPSFVVLHPSGRRLGAFRVPAEPRSLRAALGRYGAPLSELLARAEDAGGAAEVAVPEPPEAAGSAETADAAADAPGAGATAGRPTYRHPGGAFIRLSGGAWVHETDEGRREFSVYREDDRYVYLKSADETRFFAIPTDGGRVFRWDGEAESWESTWRVSAPGDD